MDLTKILIDGRFSEMEKSNIRRLVPSDPEEFRRLRSIESDPQVVAFMEGLLSTDEEMTNFAIGGERKLCVGIVGKSGVVADEEVGKLQGWVYFYPDETERLVRLKEKGILWRGWKDEDVLEVSYAKLSASVPGQISSGLRQMIRTIKGEVLNLKEKVLFVAYTDPFNEPSARVLKACGFVKVGQISYNLSDKNEDAVWILL